MYSRKTGMNFNSELAQRKIESFNNELREQYRHHNAAPINVTPKAQNNPSQQVLKTDDLVIIALMVLLLLEEKKDYLTIGILATLLLMKR